MMMSSETAVILVMLLGVGYLFYLYFRDRKQGEYVWVGPGNDPFKQVLQSDKPINDFAGRGNESSSPESEEE